MKVEFEVREDGIYRIVYLNSDVAKSEMVMDKESFIKAVSLYKEDISRLLNNSEVL